MKQTWNCLTRNRANRIAKWGETNKGTDELMMAWRDWHDWNDIIFGQAKRPEQSNLKWRDGELTGHARNERAESNRVWQNEAHDLHGMEWNE